MNKSRSLKNNDITLPANIKLLRKGTVTDGVSKLLIVVPHSTKLKFSIKDLKPNDLTDGTLAPLVTSGDAADGNGAREGGRGSDTSMVTP
jgi:hypothetical protein